MNRRKIAVLLIFFSINIFAAEFPVCKEYFFIKETETKQKLTFLEKILKQNPSNVECMLKLSSVYLRTNRVSQGFDLIRRAFALNPNFVESQNISKILDLALRVSRLKEIALKNSDKNLWNELGDVYFEIGIFDEAGFAYGESLKLDKNQTKIGILLALCDGNLDHPYKSEKRLKEIVQSQPYNFYANYYLGKVLKNSLENEKDGQKYLMMADYILRYDKPQFETQNEEIFLKNDLKFELGTK
jgi:cytochrome c-type biogenesis protein CcmH/NrfG